MREAAAEPRAGTGEPRRSQMKSRYQHSQVPRAPIAPLHRGPQARAHIAPVSQIAPVHAPNAALLIDFDNVTMGIRSDLQTELRNLLSSDIIQGKVAVQRAYADWRRYPQYIVPLSEASIDLIFAPAYGSSKKNATDIRLAIDALELVFTRPEIGTFILLSGDSDFSSLVIKLKEYGKYVIGVGIRESSSDLLVQNCDEYYSYNALAGLVKSGEAELSRKWDPWELVTEAISRMQQNHDVMRSDRLKQVMQEIDSNFDEKDLGMSKFSRFCHEAAQRGLIRTTKLENGQLEVAPASPKPARSEKIGHAERPAHNARAARNDEAEAHVAAPAERTPPAAAPSDTAARHADDDAAQAESASAEAAPDGDATVPRAEREGRPRRGRRGGRGRKRDAQTEVTLPDAALPVDATDAVVVPPPADGVHSPAEPTDAAPAAGARPARTARTRAPRKDVDESIGVSGLRLARDEAMGLVRDAVAAVANGDTAASDETVRRKVFELLGRDSESLSTRNFSRILRDAHDANIVDVRRRGDGFEVASAAEVATVADQLVERENAAKASVAPAEPVAPAPRGLVRRGAAGSGRGARAAKTPPPELLLVGVVDDVAPDGDDKPARRPRRSKPEDAATEE